MRAFYEGYPYPPPVDSLEKYRTWQDPQKQRAEHHLLWPSRAFGQDQSILIAGCGTSQAAKHAMRWPAAKVTGIDFSATSVRCTEELKRKYKLDNLQIHRLPVERARELETSFDHIVCTGVLHHLPDPDAGLAALRDVLEPHGAMHVMVYAPYGRTGIYMLQEFCKRIGVGATDVEIRDLVNALKALPSGHPLQTLLRRLRTSETRPRLPTRFCIRVIVRIRFRNYWIFSTRVAWSSADGYGRPPTVPGAESWHSCRRLPACGNWLSRNSMPRPNCFGARWCVTA